ncbi:hypothetical protein JCM3766R1_001331 [Sporobolomyces carnicolor]
MSFTSSLLSFIGFTLSPRRATPQVISSIVQNVSPASIHDRSTYTAPALRPASRAFESRLFKSHPDRFVSLSELIPGLAPPSEVQLGDLESVEARGEILAVEPEKKDELTTLLLKSLAYVCNPTPKVKLSAKDFAEPTEAQKRERRRQLEGAWDRQRRLPTDAEWDEWDYCCPSPRPDSKFSSPKVPSFLKF